MTKRERSSRPDRPSMERSLDALLDRGSLDRGSLDSGPGDSGWQQRSSLDPALLDQGARPDGDAARWQAVAQVLAALTSAPESSELTAENQALAEFRALAGFPARPHGAGFPFPTPHRGPGWMTWLRGGRPAVAVATAAVLMGGLLVVAYAGDLPDAAQRLAHDTIDAPAVGRSPSPGPDTAASSQPTSPQSPAGSAGHRGTHASALPDRRVHGGFASGRPHRSRSSSPPTGSSSGWPGSGHQGQSGSPGRSFGPGPTQEPSSSASISPSPAPAPAPSPSLSAAPSPTQSGHHPQQSPSSPQSTPP